MRAMVREPGASRLVARDVADPVPGPGQVLVRVAACGVCRTDLHVVDGDLAETGADVIPGHEIAGRVVDRGAGATRFALGARVGIPWLGVTCGRCGYCRRGRENLCAEAGFTGYTLPGGYADLVAADERFCFPLPDGYDDVHAAPLLCAGLIGYRAYRMAGAGRRLGLYGFGAAAHIIAQLAVADDRDVYAFVRPGDQSAAAFARRLGARWAGGSDELPPEPLDAAILFAPVGGLVPTALRAVDRGGVVVCAGIHMSDIPSFPYSLLWEERIVRSVANLTRADGEEFMRSAARHSIHTEVIVFPLERANEALAALRDGALSGAAVLTT